MCISRLRGLRAEGRKHSDEEYRLLDTDDFCTSVDTFVPDGNAASVFCVKYRGAYKSLARPTSRCILFDDENISFDASLVIYKVVQI